MVAKGRLWTVPVNCRPVRLFEDERGLKKLLLDRKDRFTQALTEKLLTYATGRLMTFRDQAEVEKSLPYVQRTVTACET